MRKEIKAKFDIKYRGIRKKEAKNNYYRGNIRVVVLLCFRRKKQKDFWKVLRAFKIL